jgi:phenylalanyl-tRNA synthetase beta chain|uniref:phenylalanine--tRNA ligase n=1 Tax=Palmaria decipiens TaxID=187399 RepID=A0A6C0W333_PALDE|nr:phenylalanyl-tRNA synthetase beta subunit [Palmaria decipiens]QIC19484.1 phenylalanyl-tRNA synthetase beta subunit [Palmaria decipiens]
MNISWEWLEKLIDLKGISIESIVERLTLAGFEVEDLIELPYNNKLLEVSSTTNRADTSSMMGVAKEVSAIINRELKTSANQAPLYISNKPLELNTDTPSRILQTKIINLNTNSTPSWIQSILINYGIQIENNIIDILNFIDLKWAKRFGVKRTTSPEIEACNSQEILCFYYDQTNHNDQDIQDGISQADLLTAYNECMLLIAHIYDGMVSTTYYFSSNNKVYQPVYLRNLTLQDTLGPYSYLQETSINYSRLITESMQILTRLGFIVKQYSTNLAIMVPLNRVDDVYREIDIIEEISRVYGFDKFLDRLPVSLFKGSKKHTTHRLGHIRTVLRSNGYHETTHSPLEDSFANTIAVYNPLIGEFNSLKENLLNNLLKSNIYNIKQGNGAVNIFETGRVFTKSSGYNEAIHLACIFGGDMQSRRSWNEDPLDLDWFQAKGQVEEIFERLNVDIGWSELGENQNFNKNTYCLFKDHESAVLTIDSRSIGVFGCVKPNLYNINGLKAPLYGFEILINELISPVCSAKIFRIYSKYPSIVRDITITFDTRITVRTIIDTILDNNNSIIESVKLCSLYEAQREGQKNRNLSFRITYRSVNKTLTSTIIDELECKLKEELKTKFKVNL